MKTPNMLTKIVMLIALLAFAAHARSSTHFISADLEVPSAGIEDMVIDPMIASQAGAKASAAKPGPTIAATIPAVGARKTLVILANFTDLRTQTPSPEAVRSRVFGAQAPSMADYYREVSFGKTTMTGIKNPAGDVFGWVTINARSTTCDWPRWADLARQAAQRAGFPVDSYTHILHFFARTPCPNFGASGLKGGRYSYFNGEMTTGTIIHEIGHNLGLGHANEARCTGTGGVRLALGGTRVSKDYADEFDVMGIGSLGLGHVNNFYKGRLGWLSAANTRTVSASGVYSVAPIETASSSAQSLRIPRGDGTYLYVEHRRPVGYDKYTPEAPVDYDGAIIRIAPDYGVDAESQLVDTTPFTDTVACFNCVADQTLKVDRGLFDPASKIYLKTVSVSDTALQVSVTLGYGASAPVADAGRGRPHVRGVVYQHAGASATDVDADLNTYRWELVACPGTCPALTQATGGLAGASSEIPGPSFNPTGPGLYRLKLTVWDGAGATATATVDVTVL